MIHRLTTLRRILREFCVHQAHAEYGGIVGSVPAVRHVAARVDDEDDPFEFSVRDCASLR